jgi:3',5'-cyclic AMP phosphodiesterase CpdA
MSERRLDRAANLTMVDQHDGVDRRGFLQCMAWAGTGLLWTAKGGVLRSGTLPAVLAASQRGGGSVAARDFVFAQISDSHIGFAKAANQDVVSTLQEALRRIKALALAPEFLIHTGDLTQLAKAEEFDTLDQVIKGANVGQVFFVPGEHDVVGDNGAAFLARYGQGKSGNGWFSFDHAGVHFIGLVNVLDLKAGGLGSLGADQLEWLRKDVAGLSASTPIVVFAHIPLWSVYPDWGWGTDDSTQALALLKRFGSVTVLNGHIHQTLQKVEGQITFHTACSTAFPQPAPGTAASPGPMVVPADRLRSVLGLSEIRIVQGSQALAVVDHTLAEPTSPSAAVSIDNFQFSVSALRVGRGTTVTWTNRDDVPHTVTSTTKIFSSKALDTDETFSRRFDDPGTFDYYCTMHPKMTAQVIVG